MKPENTASRLWPEQSYGEVTTVNSELLKEKLAAARAGMIALQNGDGHWCFPLEADCTIPAEYILMMHFMDDIDPVLQAQIARFLRDQQSEVNDGWPLYYGGKLDISCTVKTYYALKLAGDSPDAPHMVRARQAILERGGRHVQMYSRAYCWPCTGSYLGGECRLCR